MAGKVIATNKKAFRNFNLGDKWECGIVLKGGEVKSVRAGEVNFKASFAQVGKDGITLFNLHIAPYAQAGALNEEPDRPRKLLLHKKEITKIAALVQGKSLILVPTRMYFNARGLVKVEIALGTSKKLYDKREAVKKRDTDRDLKRALKSRRR